MVTDADFVVRLAEAYGRPASTWVPGRPRCAGLEARGRSAKQGIRLDTFGRLRRGVNCGGRQQGRGNGNENNDLKVNEKEGDCMENKTNKVNLIEITAKRKTTRPSTYIMTDAQQFDRRLRNVVWYRQRINEKEELLWK